MTIKQCKLACFIAITTLFFLNKWKWETLYEEQEYSMEALHQCVKIAQSLQHNIKPLFALGLLCFYSKGWMCLTCQQQ